MAYEWQSDIIRPDGENGTEVLDGQGVYQPQIEGGDNITIENGRINASGTLENVNADWSETDPTDPSYIEHKPDLSIYATASGMETALAGKQDEISDLATIRSGAEAGATAVQPGDLAQVATTGSYTSLSNTPQNIVQDASYVHTDNNFSNADKSKLDGIAAGAEVNQQSDWLEADSSSDAFIKNKPTIPAAQINSDWNAVSGVSQILNKPDLSAYATDTELSDGLATKQNVISDLDTIRAGAAAGATAAQPADLPSSDELVPSASSGDAGKVLTVANDGTAGWVTPSAGTVYTAGDGVDITSDVISADVDGTTIGIDSTTKKIKSLQTIPSVDQTYNASSTNAQSGVAVAGAIAAISVDEVPAVTSSDDGKVLTASDSGGSGSYSWQTAQGGGSNYTAGDGIAIDANNEISVDYSSDTLDMAPVFVNLTPHTDGSSGAYQDGTDLTNWVMNGVVGETLRVKIPSMAFLVSSFSDGDTVHIAISDNHGARFYSTALSLTSLGGPRIIDAQTVDIPLPVLSTTGWEGDMAEYPIDPESPYIRMTFARVNFGSVRDDSCATYFGGTQQAIQVANLSVGKLAVKNPLPVSTSSQADYVLKVDANGIPGWKRDGFANTAGVTDIQVVNALPAYPGATVLYLIPDA